MAHLESLGIRPDIQDVGESKTYELHGHTVTVTDVTADTDFTGKTGLMLGFNQVNRTDAQDQSGKQDMLGFNQVNRTDARVQSGKQD